MSAGPTPHAPAGASDDRAAEGRVYTVSGEDWDEIVAAANEAGDFESGEQIVINMGPQHPSTHGVLRLILTLEGETVIRAAAVIGYLHTGIEKNMEYRTWTQGVTFCTRADYLMPIFNEAAYCLGGGAAARHRGQDPRAGPDHQGADDGAQPDLLAPGRDRPDGPGTGRDHDFHCRARGCGNASSTCSS